MSAPIVFSLVDGCLPNLQAGAGALSRAQPEVWTQQLTAANQGREAYHPIKRGAQ